MNTVTERIESKDKHKEGRVARAIERQTAKLPSDLFLWAAGASIVGSLALEMVFQTKPSTRMLKGYRTGHLSTFVGQWAPTFLLLGIYNKLVKVSGSDRSER